MGETTKIAWADATFNPWIGCTKCGPGCDNCYAERDFDKRRHLAQWGQGKPRRRTSPDNWKKPLEWDHKCHEEGVTKKVFCGSLCDIGDPEVPQEWFDDVMNLVSNTPHLTWLFLTKRPESLRVRLKTIREQQSLWLGVTACNQEEADHKIPILLKTHAAKRFVSIEPMLEAIDISRFAANKRYYMTKCEYCGWVGSSEKCGCGGYFERDDIQCLACYRSIRGDDAPGLDWLIVGGETGPNAREMKSEWARSVRDQCKNAGVPFFFKQMTNKAETPDDLLIREVPQ